jgi:hypothetical protein
MKGIEAARHRNLEANCRRQYGTAEAKGNGTGSLVSPA